MDFEKLKAKHGAGGLPSVSVQALILALSRFGIAQQMMLPDRGRDLPANRQVGRGLLGRPPIAAAFVDHNILDASS